MDSQLKVVSLRDHAKVDARLTKLTTSIGPRATLTAHVLDVF